MEQGQGQGQAFSAEDNSFDPYGKRNQFLAGCRNLVNIPLFWILIGVANFTLSVVQRYKIPHDADATELRQALQLQQLLGFSSVGVVTAPWILASIWEDLMLLLNMDADGMSGNKCCAKTELIIRGRVVPLLFLLYMIFSSGMCLSGQAKNMEPVKQLHTHNALMCVASGSDGALVSDVFLTALKLAASCLVNKLTIKSTGAHLPANSQAAMKDRLMAYYLSVNLRQSLREAPDALVAYARPYFLPVAAQVNGASAPSDTEGGYGATSARTFTQQLGKQGASDALLANTGVRSQQSGYQ